MKIKSLLVLAALFGCFFFAAGNEKTTPDIITFDDLKGNIQMLATSEDSYSDSIYVDYDILWPVNGNPKLVAEVQKWIVDKIADINYSWNGKTDVVHIVDSLAVDMATTGSAWIRNINMTVEENVPVDSFLTLTLHHEYSWPGGYYILYDTSLTIRLEDGAILEADKIIADKDKFGLIIGSHLERKMKSEDPNWKPLDAQDPDGPIDLPMRDEVARLTKDGIWVGFGTRDATAYVFGGYIDIIPYSEIVQIISEEAKAFFANSLDELIPN